MTENKFKTLFSKYCIEIRLFSSEKLVFEKEKSWFERFYACNVFGSG